MHLEPFHHGYYRTYPDEFKKHLLCNMNQPELNTLVDFVFQHGIKCHFKDIDEFLNKKISWNATFCYYAYPIMFADKERCNIMDFTHDLAHVIYMSENQRKQLTLSHSLKTHGSISDSRWKGQEENHVLLIQLELGKFLKHSLPNMIQLMDAYRYLSGRAKSVEQLMQNMNDPIEFPILPQFDDLVWIE
jgi:hypothetical protein